MTDYPRYELTEAGNGLDGSYWPNDCSQGRLHLSSNSDTNIIKFKPELGWTLYKYSTDLSDCDGRNVNMCPRTYGLAQSDTISPPQSAIWHMSDTGFSGLAQKYYKYS